MVFCLVAPTNFELTAFGKFVRSLEKNCFVQRLDYP